MENIMLYKKFENNRDVLEMCLELIEKDVNLSRTAETINSNLRNEFVSYNYMNNIFNEVMPFTLAEYIRRRTLTEAYFKWYNQKPVQRYRDKFNNIKNFAAKFKREFGMTLEEAFQQKVTIEDLQEPISMDKIEEILLIETSRFVDHISFEKGMVEICINKLNLLCQAMSEKIYQLPVHPKELFDTFKEANFDEKCDMLIIFSSEFDQKGHTRIKLEEYNQALKYLRLINLDFPEKCGGLYIFQPYTPPYFEEFIEILNLKFGNLRTTLPLKLIPSDLGEKLIMISEENDLNNLADKFQVNKDKMIEILWDYVNKGYLRLT